MRALPLLLAALATPLGLPAAGAVGTEPGDFVRIWSEPGAMVLEAPDGSRYAGFERIDLPPGLEAEGVWRVTFASSRPDLYVNLFDWVCIVEPACYPYPNVWVCPCYHFHVEARIAGWNAYYGPRYCLDGSVAEVTLDHTLRRVEHTCPSGYIPIVG